MLVLFSFFGYCVCAKDLDVALPGITISKCCNAEELHNLDCQHVNLTDSSPWKPLFYDERLHPNAQVPGKSNSIV